MNDLQQTASNQQQPELEANSQPPKQGMSGCAQAAIGFGIFSFILLCIGLAGVFWLVQNARGFAESMVTPAIQNVVSQMEIPAQQKKQISARIEELGEDFKAQKISVNELKTILTGVIASPISAAAGTIWFTEQYISKSGLTAAEKKDATLTAKRFAKGLLDTSITNNEANEVMDMISVETPNGETNIKQTLTDKELRDILLKMKTAADAAGIPADVPDINFATEFDKVVDGVLNGTPESGTPVAPAPSVEPNTTTNGANTGPDQPAPDEPTASEASP
jgi:hypothetical protein